MNMPARIPMMWETASKGCMLCLGRVGCVADCILYLVVGSLVRISMRRRVVICLPGYQFIFNQNAFKTKLVRINPVHC